MFLLVSADSGADDLVPVISYVVLQSRLPQLVSECHAMSEFIHEGYVSLYASFLALLTHVGILWAQKLKRTPSKCRCAF